MERPEPSVVAMPQLCLIVDFELSRVAPPTRPADPDRSTAPGDPVATRSALRRVVARELDPALTLFERLAARNGDGFRVAVGLAANVAEQLAVWEPAVIDAIRRLAADGAVELLGGTYHRTADVLNDPDRFSADVELHGAALRRLFDVTPRVFMSPPSLYRDDLPPLLARLGYDGAIAPDLPDPMDRRSPDELYRAALAPGFRLMPRNDRVLRRPAATTTRFPGTARPAPEAVAEAVAASGSGTVRLVLDRHHADRALALDQANTLAAFISACDRHGVTLVHPGQILSAAPRGTLWYPRSGEPWATSKFRRPHPALTINDLPDLASDRPVSHLQPGIPWPRPIHEPVWQAHRVAASGLTA